MANIKKIISENGIVLEKIFKAATNEFVNQAGQTVAAQPDRYLLKVVSGECFDKDNGFSNSTILDYKVDYMTYSKVVPLTTKVNVKYELSNFGVKAVSLEIKV